MNFHGRENIPIFINSVFIYWQFYGDTKSAILNYKRIVKREPIVTVNVRWNVQNIQLTVECRVYQERACDVPYDLNFDRPG